MKFYHHQLPYDWGCSDLWASNPTSLSQLSDFAESRIVEPTYDSNMQIRCSDSWNIEYLPQLPFDRSPWPHLPPMLDFTVDSVKESSVAQDCSEIVQQYDSCNNQVHLHTGQRELQYSQYYSEPYIPLESAYPVDVFQPPVTVGEEDYNDGCTYEELLEILNSGDEPVNNPSPKIEKSFSRSSSTNHEPKDMKQKRRRRPSVKFADLIKKKKLLLGDKVYYMRKNMIELGAGIVKETGIQCCCCGNVYSMSKFEEHTVLKVNGKLSHRAPTHIYLGNGSSLEKLQLEILQDRND